MYTVIECIIDPEKEPLIKQEVGDALYDCPGVFSVSMLHRTRESVLQCEPGDCLVQFEVRHEQSPEENAYVNEHRESGSSEEETWLRHRYIKSAVEQWAAAQETNPISALCMRGARHEELDGE